MKYILTTSEMVFLRFQNFEGFMLCINISSLQQNTQGCLDMSF